MPGKRPEPSFEFVQLLTTHQSRMFAYILSLLGNRTQAEDVMQETNAVLWRKAHEFKLGTNLSLIHISEPTRQEAISYAVFCLKKKK